MKRLALVILIGLGACYSGGEVSRPDIAPTDFAIVSCGPGDANTPCALAVIGGKRLLFGAPAGVASTLEAADLKLLDAVFLFSLRARDIEGLDEVRNASWRAGRTEPLSVIGPDGTAQTVAALNLAFETADALRIVDEGIPSGGYDGAVLTLAQPVGERADLVFDTGDVQVTFEVRNDQALRYQIGYLSGEALTLEPCVDDMCYIAEGLNWPLKGTTFIVRN